MRNRQLQFQLRFVSAHVSSPRFAIPQMANVRQQLTKDTKRTAIRGYSDIGDDLAFGFLFAPEPAKNSTIRLEGELLINKNGYIEYLEVLVPRAQRIVPMRVEVNPLPVSAGGMLTVKLEMSVTM